MQEDIPTTGWKKDKTILEKNMGTKDIYQKSRMHIKTWKVPNWKRSGHDGIRRYWFKKFSFIQDGLAIEMNRRLEETDMPYWMTKGWTTLIQKDNQKRAVSNNYRPITCLVKMRKILIAQLREEIKYSLISPGLFL